MDMRHVMVVGYGAGETVGDIVEEIQKIFGRIDTARDPQDYYSNKMGAYFYQLRNTANWSTSSWTYDFERFIKTQYENLSGEIIPKSQ